jgi:tRNA U34 5-methylaminomethyl-2-thiouridine-forming methyltransferase MnmC
MRWERVIIPTADGSHTISIPEMNVTYHSHHGAVQESLHVFIEAGLRHAWQRKEGPLRILEMGLGTGLNALLTMREAEKSQWLIHYTALELYPLQQQEWQGLQFLQIENEMQWLQEIHESCWSKDVPLNPYFTLRKEQQDLRMFTTTEQFDLVYYDAFAPSAQPELWTEAIFRKLFDLMNEGGVLVTYCSKGDVRRAMQAAGFQVQKIPGPKGKREMVRAEVGSKK